MSIPLDELEALADNEDVRYASSAGVLRFGVQFLTDDTPQAPPPPRIKARVRIRFEACDAVVKASLCASGKAVECSLSEARTVVLRSSHSEIDVLCISTAEGSLRVPLGLLPDGKYPTETWSVGADVQLSLRVERASEERPATPASPGVPVEQNPSLGKGASSRPPPKVSKGPCPSAARWSACRKIRSWWTATAGGSSRI